MIIDAKVLIVEDEFIEATDLKRRLEKLGYSVVGMTANGEDAVKKAEELYPNLILMDIILKGRMNGIETAKRITDNHDIPIIYLTAYFDGKTLEKAKKTAPYGYVVKPYEDMGLKSAIELAVYNHHNEKCLNDNTKGLEVFK